MTPKLETTAQPVGKTSKAAFVAGLALFTLAAGCVTQVRHEVVYDDPPPRYVPSQVVYRDDYVYYPGYEVYYSNNRRQFTYREGHSWVSRPTPPHVSAEVLLAAPSVRLDFHDSPASHHSTVVRQYPKHWSPPGSNHGPRNDRDERPRGR